MERINKVEAGKLFKKGQIIYLLPSRLIPAVHAPSSYIKSDYSETFDELVKGFELHYCSKFVGRKCAFWIYR